MRFQKTKQFKIDELELDEGNYRFKRAGDQKACVKKIYSMNKEYFRGLLKSIAENDLGEVLLVYIDGDKNIVADGNRRVSALKVLYDDEFAPTEKIKEEAGKLRKLHKINFNKIQAQVSDDKSLISKTVYERHSGGKNGTSRIPWAAYAASRFGFDEGIGDDREWYIMALLSKTEKEKPNISGFLDGTGFSYEVYRRLIRAARKKGIISEMIFSERGEKIKATARKDLVTDAVNKSYDFLQAMKKKKITLSRKDGGYADKGAVDKFLALYTLSPDNKELEEARLEGGMGGVSLEQELNPMHTDASASQSGHFTENISESASSGQRSNDNITDASQVVSAKEYGINKSEQIEQQLKRLRSNKLSNLYRSLYTVSLVQHPQLMYVGAWSFFESLAASYAKKGNHDFVGHFNNLMNNSWGWKKQQRSDSSVALDDISKKGNANKHSSNYNTANAQQLKTDFQVLEPLILKALDEIINEQ